MSTAASCPPAASHRLYVVLTYVPRRTTMTIGALGPVPFERGWYAYVGSAVRGRRARVARHLAAEKPRRWHADYLFTAFTPRRAWLVDGAAGECELAAGLAAPPGE
jgi:Uri superfamily endonuclease